MRKKGTTLAERLASLQNENKKQGGRPPLVPLGHDFKHQSPRMPLQHMEEPPSPERVFFSTSEHSDIPLQYSAEQEDKFELMNVTLVVYGLSGVMCEKEQGNKKASKFGRKDKVSKWGDGSAKSMKGGATVSTTSASIDPSAVEESAFQESTGAPTTAVVSYRKNAFSSQTALETFLPSVPLCQPTATYGQKYRYTASWPSEQSTLTKDESALERSSFKLTRCMQQEAFVPGAGVGSNYVHETIELRINLSRGTELIPLGTASIAISGEEEGEVMVNIPTKPCVRKNKKLSHNRRKAKSKSNKYGYFSSDLTRKYYLDENATLRVGIRVVPQDALKIAEEREKEEIMLRQILGSDDLKQMAGNLTENIGRVPAPGGGVHTTPMQVRSPREDDAPSESLFQTFLCGAVLCANHYGKEEKSVTDKPMEFIDTNDYGHLGVGSLISSVSESTDGSEFSEGEMEAQMNNFRTATAFRRYT